MYAIFDRETGQLSFAVRIAPGFRDRWQKGVTLDPLPADLSTLPDGALWDDRVVGVRSGDHGHYRVFSDTADVEGSGFRSTGMIYGGTFDDFPPRSLREAAWMGITGP
jgi:hypothetical protein